ncbi:MULTISPECIES: hypothetical protein [unclassified Pseudomonas]|jgi:hypothetical protein|uniref:hypothetical protein n=1 Tax=unclassified Pseudomonas TaxID=196821 RepID=UPI00026F717F|nr:hypothetical protein [Pseudomonas sp. GM80]EJN31710.1 hypothetical protein PMI37_02553 [Pseudomonas sp. GM80]
MTRQRAAQVRISPLHLQQALFGVLALLITLIACQQYLRWENSQQPEAPLISMQHATQSHFSAVSSSVQDDNATMRMVDVDQAQPLDQMPREERWVF